MIDPVYFSLPPVPPCPCISDCSGPSDHPSSSVSHFRSHSSSVRPFSMQHTPFSRISRRRASFKNIFSLLAFLSYFGGTSSYLHTSRSLSLICCCCIITTSAAGDFPFFFCYAYSIVRGGLALILFWFFLPQILSLSLLLQFFFLLSIESDTLR